MTTGDRLLDELAGRLRGELVEWRRAEAAAGRSGEESIEAAVREIVDLRAAILGDSDRDALGTRILRDTAGLGPLEELLEDPGVEEVMVNGAGAVYVERAGRIEATEVGFNDEEELRNAIERILAPLGRRVDELSPM